MRQLKDNRAPIYTVVTVVPKSVFWEPALGLTQASLPTAEDLGLVQFSALQFHWEPNISFVAQSIFGVIQDAITQHFH